MLRLVRLSVLLGLAFLGGIAFERSRAHEVCAAGAGVWRDGVCLNAEGQDD